MIPIRWVIEIPEAGQAVQFGRFNQGGKLSIFEPEVNGLDGVPKRNSTPKPTKGLDELKKKYAGYSDDLNPLLMFQTMKTELLLEILKKEFNLYHLVRIELANRGLNKTGKWVGFEEARRVHKI